MPALTGWNLANTQTVNATSPDGQTWIYPDAVAAAEIAAGTGLGQHGVCHLGTG